ncbi:TlpA family protein disulfide reductase [Singulisphaera sp. PoT]|uniref:TlpA family protein disulfide reductase n=1 Tax=Singulisphaera sp. PoT TaxID=3411797 RepID=UPI003BF4DF6B
MLRSFLWVGLTFGVTIPALADGRSAEKILADIEAVKPPDRPQTEDREAVVKYYEKLRQADAKKADLILELYKSHPEHAQVITLLPTRWMTLFRTQKDGKDLVKEIDEATAKVKNESLTLEGAFMKAVSALYTGPEEPDDAAVATVDDFIKLAPGDRRGAQFLAMLAEKSKDEAKKSAFEDRVLKEYPKSPYTSIIQGGRLQRKSIGKPFELAFSDAMTGTEISIAGLKGKVVVIDFWATWCGPCIAEMPKMKDLYAKFKDQGVQFIGVSLDEPKDDGGLDKLKAFVTENKIPWPQYYQGNGWDSEFSKSWGINSIPSLFVVDTEGKLASVDARGKLEELIPELLKKAKPAGASE